MAFARARMLTMAEHPGGRDLDLEFQVAPNLKAHVSRMLRRLCSAWLQRLHIPDNISDRIKGRGPTDHDTSEGVPVPVGGSMAMRRKHVLRSLFNDVLT